MTTRCSVNIYENFVITKQCSFSRMIKMDMIPAIDIHVHPVLGESKQESIEICLREARSFHLQTMYVMGNVSVFGENPVEQEVKAINDESITIVRKYPENFIGFCLINPNNNRQFILEETERCIKHAGFKGIKLWISVKARDKKLDVIMQRAEEYNIPVLQHTWYKSMGNLEWESDPSDIACLASRFPKVTIIMAHAGGCGIRGMIDIERFSNVYVETSGSQPASGLIEFAVDRLGPERILFGSDMPCRCLASQLGRIYGAKVNKRIKTMILRENAEKILGIK